MPPRFRSIRPKRNPFNAAHIHPPVALFSACAVNRPAGWRKSGTRTGQRRATGCSIRMVQSGTVNDHGSSVRRLRAVPISVSPEGLCAAQRGPLSAVGRRPGCSQRGTRVHSAAGLPRPRGRSGGSFPCHGDALKSLACGNAGVRVILRRKRAEAMTALEPCSRKPKQLDAGYSRRRSARSLCGWPPRARPPRRSGPTPRRCSGSPPPAYPGQASWEQAGSQDIQQWMTWLLDRYSNAYASNQYRALQQFFKWLAAEDELPDVPRRAGWARPRHAGWA